jgi:hypothetical protein
VAMVLLAGLGVLALAAAVVIVVAVLANEGNR